jgi:glyoxylase-like metal-dependent hydrolase (beta-lactamase superfamily II)
MTAAGLWILRAPNPSPMTLDGTRTYLVGLRDSVVIDPGPAIRSHIDAILSALGGAVPRAIVLTHLHRDHAGAARALQERTGAPVWCGPPAEISDASLLPPEVTHLQTGTRVSTDSGTLEVVATPGHAREHLALLWRGGSAPPGGAIFVGDLMMGSGDTALVAPPEGNLADYLDSLATVERLAPAVIYPAHGPPITDPPSAIRRYRIHRAERIEQVRAALADGPHLQPYDLVDRVYGADLDPSLRRAAAGSLEAIREYLRGEAVSRRG